MSSYASHLASAAGKIDALSSAVDALLATPSSPPPGPPPGPAPGPGHGPPLSSTMFSRHTTRSPSPPPHTARSPPHAEVRSHLHSARNTLYELEALTAAQASGLGDLLHPPPPLQNTPSPSRPAWRRDAEVAVASSQALRSSSRLQESLHSHHILSPRLDSLHPPPPPSVYSLPRSSYSFHPTFYRPVYSRSTLSSTLRPSSSYVSSIRSGGSLRSTGLRSSVRHSPRARPSFSARLSSAYARTTTPSASLRASRSSSVLSEVHQLSRRVDDLQRILSRSSSPSSSPHSVSHLGSTLRSTLRDTLRSTHSDVDPNVDSPPHDTAPKDDDNLSLDDLDNTSS